MAQFLADNNPGIDNFPAFIKEWDDDYYDFATKHVKKVTRFATMMILEKLKDARENPEKVAKHVRDLIMSAEWYLEHVQSLRFRNFL